MKQIYNYILEKLHINKDTKYHQVVNKGDYGIEVVLEDGSLNNTCKTFTIGLYDCKVNKIDKTKTGYNVSIKRISDHINLNTDVKVNSKGILQYNDDDQYAIYIFGDTAISFIEEYNEVDDFKDIDFEKYFDDFPKPDVVDTFQEISKKKIESIINKLKNETDR